jgi:hypothetical protein
MNRSTAPVPNSSPAWAVSDRVAGSTTHTSLVPAASQSVVFAATAAGYQGSVERLAKFCACLGDLADAGALPFPRAAVEAFMNARREEGWPAVRHSEAYRAAHAPAYRVVDLQLLPALAPAAKAGA